MLAALAAVWAGRGDRRRRWFAGAGWAGWLALDVLVDRSNVSGGWACAGVAVGGGALVAGVWRLAARAEPCTQWGRARRSPPRR